MRRSAVLMLLTLLRAATASAGTIDTLAGTGQPDAGGDGGPARLATLMEPFHCEFDRLGGLLIADAPAGRVRRVDLGTGRIGAVVGDGPESPTGIGVPHAIAADSNGDLYLVDQKTPVVRKVDGKDGRIMILTGTGKPGSGGDGGPATRAQLREPNDCCLDGRGGLLIADVADWRVRRVDLASGVITTFAGTGKPARRPDRSHVGDGGPTVAAVVVGARAACVDGRGSTYLCEREGHAIRKVDA